MTYRVVQWGTGWAGRQAIQGILSHPDLELVGCWVSSDAKKGADAGVLAGVDPIGVTATRDVDELLALGADCHSYMTLGHFADLRDQAVVQICRLLEAGQNVVQISVLPLLYPQFAPPAMREAVEAACAVGGATCFGSGIDPGFVNDTVALALLSSCERVNKVTFSEILDYTEYYGGSEAEGMGAGSALDAPRGDPRKNDELYIEIFGPHLLHIADRLDVKVDGFRTRTEVAPATQRIEWDGYVVEPGTVGARRMVIEACVGDRAAFVEDHITRYDPVAAPEWPMPPAGSSGCYRIEIEGSLSWTCDLNLTGRRPRPQGAFAAESAQLGAFMATAMRVVNAIPFVCQAEPGLRYAMDLDTTKGLHVFE